MCLHKRIAFFDLPLGATAFSEKKDHTRTIHYTADTLTHCKLYKTDVQVASSSFFFHVFKQRFSLCSKSSLESHSFHFTLNATNLCNFDERRTLEVNS